MKKIFAMVLAAAMVMTMGVCAMAENTITKDAAKQIALEKAGKTAEQVWSGRSSSWKVAWSMSSTSTPVLPPCWSSTSTARTDVRVDGQGAIPVRFLFCYGCERKGICFFRFAGGCDIIKSRYTRTTAFWRKR